MASKRKADEAHKKTDRELAKLEKKIAAVYKEAADEMAETVNSYFAKFAKRDAEQLAAMEAGKITKEQYNQWRLAQIGRGTRYREMRDKLAERYTKANEVATAYVNDSTPGIYSLNRNYAAYTIAKTGANVAFDIWNEQTVKRLITENPDLMPYYPQSKAVKRGIDLAYGKQQINAAVTSGILQGKSVYKIADDLQNRIETMSRTSAIRAARTSITEAENSGRMAAMAAASKAGVKNLQKKWRATKDERTRAEHGEADSQIVDWYKPFIVGGEKLMEPGDKSGSGWNIYNCRCHMETGSDLDLEAEPRQIRVRDPQTGKNVVVNDMSYTEWKNWSQKNNYGGIIGLETSEGTTINGITYHALTQSNARVVSLNSMQDAIASPLKAEAIKTDGKGQRSQKYIGSTSTVSVNPDTGLIITAWRTGERERKKYS